MQLFFNPPNYKYAIFYQEYFKRQEKYKTQENIKHQEQQLTFELSSIINTIDNQIIDNLIIELSLSAIQQI